MSGDRVGVATRAMMAATLLGHLAGSDQEAVDDLLGLTRNISPRPGGESYRARRVRAMAELADEIANVVEEMATDRD